MNQDSHQTEADESRTKADFGVDRLPKGYSAQLRSCGRRIKKAAKGLGLTPQVRLWEKLRGEVAIGEEIFKKLLNGRPDSRWPRVFSAIAEIFARQEYILRNSANPSDLALASRINDYKEFIIDDGPISVLVQAEDQFPAASRNTDPKIDVVGKEFVIKNGIDWLEFLKTLRQVNHATVDSLRDRPFEENEMEAPLRDLIPVYRDHQETWRVLVDSVGNVLGYWHFNVLTPEMYERARTGKMLDRELTRHAIRKMNVGQYDIYIAFVGFIQPEIRGLDRFNRLLKSFLRAVADLAERDTYIGSICACCLSDDSKNMCIDLDIRPIMPHEQEREGFIYEGTMRGVLMRLDKLPGFRRSYAALYNRYFPC